MRYLLCSLVLLLSWPAAAVVTPLAGASGQHNFVGVSFPNPIGVRVTTAAGAPAPGAEVTFTINDGITLASGRTAPLGRIEGQIRETVCPDSGTRVTTCVVIADSNGVATLPPAYGTVAGRYTILATARFGSEVSVGSIQLIADPGATLATVRLATDIRVVTASEVDTPLKVDVTRANGAPAVDYEVLFCLDARFAIFSTPAAQGCFATRTDLAGTAVTPPIRSVANGVSGLYVRVYDSFAISYVEREYSLTILNDRGITGNLPISMQALWWGGVFQNGWGLSIMEHDRRFFMVLFSYDATGRGTWFVAPDGRWSNGQPGSSIESLVYRANGAPYFAYDASQFRLSDPYLGVNYQPTRTSPPEQMSVHFLANGRASLDGDFNLRGYLTDYSVVPILAQQFAGTTPSPITGLADMWWGGPSQAGWGVAIHEQFGALFAVWFTYDAGGYPIWFVMPSGRWVNGNTYEGDAYLTASSAFGFLGETYNASLLRLDKVGKLRFVFSDRNNAVMEYDVEGRQGSNPLVRQPF